MIHSLSRNPNNKKFNQTSGLKWSPRFLQPEENKRLVTTVSKSQVKKYTLVALIDGKRLGLT